MKKPLPLPRIIALTLLGAILLALAVGLRPLELWRGLPADTLRLSAAP